MKNESIINYFDRESIEATEFRRLYLNIRNSANGETKAVAVTSAILEEGKSTVSSFLALTAAASSNDRILLLDGDLRRPKIHLLFRFPLKPGLVDILRKDCPVKEAIHLTPASGLSVITAGILDDEPTLLLNETRLRELFEELKFYFDFIVVDVPPVIPVSDPVVIGSELDGVLVVVRVGRTPREIVKRSVNFLHNSRVKVLGVVLNNLEEVLPYYYKSKHYGYDYYSRGKSQSKK